jgi:hypothetical protein
METYAIIVKERELLKNELQALKHCQVQYFALGVTATGVALGLADKLGTESSSRLIYYAPLLIVVPCWTIFFDKATTISRIVGYSRVLETVIAGETKYRYLGWENALRSFRDRETQDARKTIVQDLRDMIAHLPGAVCLLLDFRRQHRYWIINWTTFFGLAAGSMLLALFYGGGLTGAWCFFGILFLLATLHNADILWSLMKGKYSYDQREALWREVLISPGTPPDAGM